MSKVTTTRNAAESYRASVVQVRDSIFEHSDLIFGVGRLRKYGPAAAEAVADVLEVPELRVLRLSWEFLEALIAGDDGDAEAVFTEVLGEQLLSRARFALWGETF